MKNNLISSWLIIYCCLVLIVQITAQDNRGLKPAKSAIDSSTTTRAVLIGISDYQNPDIPDLQFAHKDAMTFYTFLQSKAGGSLSEEHIMLLTDSLATKGKIAMALEWLMEESKKGDKAIIYFAGHGDVETKTKVPHGFLLTYDSPPNSYMAGAFAIYFLESIISTLSQNDIEVMMISDACRSGTLAGQEVGGAGLTSQILAQQFANEVKILSCQADEFSIEGKQWGEGRGVFSYHLLEGLTGLADKNQNGQISLLEIENYLEEKVPEETAPHSQIPMTVGRKSAKIAQVDSSALLKLIDEKRNNRPIFSSVDTKTLATALEAKDSLGWAVYQAFLDAIEQQALVIPEGNCAYDYYEQLIEVPSMASIHGLAKRNLVAALLDETQQSLNAYLRSDSTELARRYAQKQSYRLYSLYIGLASELLGDQHYMYEYLLGRKSYFEGLSLRLALEQQEVYDFLAIRKMILLQKKALAYEKNAAYVYLELGLLHEKIYNFQEAVRYYQEAIVLSPTWRLPYEYLANCYNKMGHETGAIQYYEQALELDSTDVTIYYRIAELYRKNGKEEAYRKYFGKWKKNAPQNAQYYQMMTQYHNRNQNIIEARKAMKKEFHLLSDKSLRKNKLILSLYSTDKDKSYQDKNTYFLELINKLPPPHSLILYQSINNAIWEADKKSKVSIDIIKLKNLTKNKALVSSDSLSYYEEQLLYYTQQAAQNMAYEEFKMSDFGRVYGVFACNYSLREKVFRQILDANPKNPFTYIALAEHLMDREVLKESDTLKIQEALDLYQKALKIIPTHSVFHQDLGGIYAGLGQFENAQAAYEMAIHHNPFSARAYTAYIDLLLFLNKNEQAQVVAQKWVEQTSDAQAMLSLSNILFLNQHNEQADSLLQKIIMTNEENSTILGKIGKIYSQYRQHEKGIRLLEQAIKTAEKQIDESSYQAKNVTVFQPKQLYALSSLYNSLGVAYVFHQSYREARLAFDNAVVLKLNTYSYRKLNLSMGEIVETMSLYAKSYVFLNKNMAYKIKYKPKKHRSIIEAICPQSYGFQEVGFQRILSHRDHVFFFDLLEKSLQDHILQLCKAEQFEKATEQLNVAVQKKLVKKEHLLERKTWHFLKSYQALDGFLE